MENIKHILIDPIFSPPTSISLTENMTKTQNPLYNKTQENDTTMKQIIMHYPKPEEKKQEQEKQTPQKRQITTTNQWRFTNADLELDNQYTILYDTSKTHFIYQQIKNKLSSYRCQDIDKNLFNKPEFSDLSGVLQKMENCRLLCFYCKEPVLLLYENVREPKQWTLERIDNKKGHTMDNVEIACLSCNLRRRTMHHERYIMTKNIKNIKKV